MSNNHQDQENQEFQQDLSLQNRNRISLDKFIEILNWYPKFSIFNNETWTCLREIGRLNFLNENSPPRILEIQISSPNHSNFAHIPNNLIQDSFSRLRSAWNFDQTENILKLLANRISQVWLWGLPDLINQSNLVIQVYDWLLGNLEIVDFLISALATYPELHSLARILHKAWPALFQLYTFNHLPSINNNNINNLLTIQRNRVKDLIIKFIYKSYPQSNISAYPNQALIPKNPLYLSKSTRDFLVAIYAQHQKPFFKLLGGTIETVCRSLLEIESNEKQQQPKQQQKQQQPTQQQQQQQQQRPTQQQQQQQIPPTTTTTTPHSNQIIQSIINTENNQNNLRRRRSVHFADQTEVIPHRALPENTLDSNELLNQLFNPDLTFFSNSFPSIQSNLFQNFQSSTRLTPTNSNSLLFNHHHNINNINNPLISHENSHHYPLSFNQPPISPQATDQNLNNNIPEILPHPTQILNTNLTYSPKLISTNNLLDHHSTPLLSTSQNITQTNLTPNIQAQTKTPLKRSTQKSSSQPIRSSNRLKLASKNSKGIKSSSTSSSISNHQSSSQTSLRNQKTSRNSKQKALLQKSSQSDKIPTNQPSKRKRKSSLSDQDQNQRPSKKPAKPKPKPKSKSKSKSKSTKRSTK